MKIDEEMIKQEINNILYEFQETCKIGSDGDYSTELCVFDYSFETVAERVRQFIHSIVDPENQPNQYGITLFTTQSQPIPDLSKLVTDDEIEGIIYVEAGGSSSESEQDRFMMRKGLKLMRNLIQQRLEGRERE